MMNKDLATRIRKLTQQYAYTSIRMHETVARRAGLSGTDHKYLGFLIEKGEMTAGELAALTGLTTGAVTGLIDRFEKRGLVMRRFSTDDRRKVMIVPETDKIMALLAPLYKDFRTQSESLVTLFTKAEIETIETYFSKSIELMERVTSDLEIEK